MKPAWTGSTWPTTVYQEFALATQLDITQNMFLGREARKPGVLGSVLRQLDKKRMRQQAAEQMQLGCWDRRHRAGAAVVLTPNKTSGSNPVPSDFTGQQAVLDGDGRSFDTVAAQRVR